MRLSIRKYLVAEWWEDRLILGTQLVDPSPEDFTRGGTGDGETWFRTVSIQALYRDFQLFAKNRPEWARTGEISCSGFMMMLRDMLPSDIETKYVRTRYGRARCIRFKDREAYLVREAA